MIRGKEEMMDSGSGSEHAEEKYSEQETEEQQQQQPPKKKRYHRHTAHQIQEMEKYDTHHNPLLLYNFSQYGVRFQSGTDPHWNSALGNLLPTILSR